MRAPFTTSVCIVLLANFGVGSGHKIRTRRQSDSSFRYSCVDICGSPAPQINVTDPYASTCSCEETCLENKTCCADYLPACAGETPWRDKPCDAYENESCPTNWNKTVIQISLDGFRMEYLDRVQAAVVNRMRSCGVHVPFQRSSFPTVTFPNHFSIATGLYTESHGIIANSFQDGDLNDYYNPFHSDPRHNCDEKWYSGEPIWNTVERQGKRSASYMWPSSECPMNGNSTPSNVIAYSDQPTYEHRVYKILEWLDLPDGERPEYIAAYFDEPDHSGHYEGVDSDPINVMIERVNSVVELLLEGLAQRKLLNCVNILIQADHGMSPNSADRRSFMEDYGFSCNDYRTTGAYCYTGVVARVGPALFSYRDFWNLTQEWDKLKCSRQGNSEGEKPAKWRAYRKDIDLPKRLHYAVTDRIEPIVMPLDDTWYSSKGETSSYTLVGNHGYDNMYENMRALFVGYGTDFKQSHTTEYIHQNIELYALMCHLLGVEPSPNNGTSGAMNHLLKDDVQMPVVSLGGADVYVSNDLSDKNIEAAMCQCGYSAQDADLLDLNDLTNGPSLPKYTGTATIYAMPYTDYTAAVTENEVTLVTAYTVQRGSKTGTRESCLRHDPRSTTALEDVCPTLENPMFYRHPSLSSDSLFYDNIVSTSQYNSQFARYWDRLTSTYLQIWAAENDVTVYTGPIWDRDNNGHADVDMTGRPTHYFFMMERAGAVLSFILPNYHTDIDCNIDLTTSEDMQLVTMLKQHQARIRDVELLTGFNFEFGDLSVESVQRRLFINEWSDFWNEEDIYNFVPEPEVTTTDTVTQVNAANSLAAQLFGVSLCSFLYLC